MVILSVMISTMASSRSTGSPISLSQRVMVPSTTDSPSGGTTMVTSMALSPL